MIALAGNPNCGKTTLFNRLTHGRERVGNRSGVTTEAKIGIWGKEKLVDLPGVYSFSETEAEEKEAKKMLLNGKIDGILNIIDATNLERSLMLTTQLAELKIPMIVALNMSDLLERGGFEIDINLFSKLLGVNVVMISASSGKGCELLEKTEKKVPLKIENSEKWIKEISAKILRKKGENTLIEKSIKIDKVLLGKFSIPILIFVLGTVFLLTFCFPGKFCGDICTLVFEKFMLFSEKMLARFKVNYFLQSLVCDGILKSLGGIIPFFPQIMILFLCISFLEDIGYMPRAIFAADRMMSRIGLDGRALVAVISGLGCSVPAVMAVRNIDDEKRRHLTVELLPFFPCSAKIPVFMMFSSVFFDKEFLLWLYLLSLTSGFLYALIFEKESDNGGFVLELPPYRKPTLQNTINQMLEKLIDFFKRAACIIFISGIVIWFLENFTFALEMTNDSQKSMLGIMGSFFAPVFAPCGFGTWQATISLMAGIMAKEAIVSTLTITCGNLSLSSMFNSVSALSFMVFVLFYPPCIATLAAMSDEISARKTIKLVIRQFCIAWIAAFLIYLMFN